jgi:hypothetical protein
MPRAGTKGNFVTVRLEQDAYELLMEQWNGTGYAQNLIVSDCITRTLKHGSKVNRDEIGRPRPRPRSEAAKPEGGARSEI